jgi:hypothetical protein
MLLCIVAKAIRDIWSDRVSFTFRVRRLKKNVDCLALKMNAIRPFETSGNTCPTTLRHTQEDLSLLNQFRIHGDHEDGGSMLLRKDNSNLHVHVLSGPRRMYSEGSENWFYLSLYLSLFIQIAVISGSLSPPHGAFSGCGWRNGLQILRVAANILNKQSQTADRVWSSSLKVGRGANNSSP